MATKQKGHTQVNDEQLLQLYVHQTSSLFAWAICSLQLATAEMMETIEAKADVMKTARKNFYEPDVQYERLTPMMKQYLSTVGEKLVAACSRAMAEEAKRSNILAAMPSNAPGYQPTQRAFELERLRERKVKS